MMLNNIASNLGVVIGNYNNTVVVGRLHSFNPDTGLAQVESLNDYHTDHVIIDNVVVLNHQLQYDEINPGATTAETSTIQHNLQIAVGEYVLLLRINQLLYVLLGTLNGIRSIE